jgi:hypothetical protein
MFGSVICYPAFSEAGKNLNASIKIIDWKF